MQNRLFSGQVVEEAEMPGLVGRVQLFQEEPPEQPRERFRSLTRCGLEDILLSAKFASQRHYRCGIFPQTAAGGDNEPENIDFRWVGRPVWVQHGPSSELLQ